MAAVVIVAALGLQGIFATPGSADYFLIFGALSLFFWVGGARVIRSQVLALRETEYVLAARSMGAGTWRILISHLLPNVSPIIIVGVSASLGAIAGSEIALTFLGVGVHDPTPSFGALISDAAPEPVLRNAPLPDDLPGRRRRDAHLRLQPPRRRPQRRLHPPRALAREHLGRGSLPSSKAKGRRNANLRVQLPR